MKGFLIGLLLSFFLISLQFNVFSTERIIGDRWDNYEFFSFQYLVREKLARFEYPLGKTNLLRYPFGFNLGKGYDGVLATFSGAILGFILPAPIAYSLTVVFILALNFYLTFWAAGKMGADKRTALISSLFFGLSPYVFARINSHLNLAFIGGFPVFLYSILSLYEKVLSKKANLKDFLLCFTGLLLIIFGSLQYLIILLYTIFFLALFLIFFRKYMFRRTKEILIIISNFFLKEFLITFLFFTVILFYFYGQYFLGFLTGKLVFPSLTRWNVGLLDIFIPNQYLGAFWAKVNSSPSDIEKVVSLGIVGWTLFLMLILRQSLKEKVFLVFSFLFFLTSAIGIVKLPLVPEGGRITVIFSLIVFYFLAKEKAFSRKYLFWLFLIFLLLEKLSFRFYSSPLFPEKQAQIVQNLPGEAVLNIPLSAKESGYRSSFVYSFNKKIVDGYFHYTADDENANKLLNNNLFSRYICNGEKGYTNILAFDSKDTENTLDILKSFEIKTIVVHKDPLWEKYLHSNCENVRYFWINFNPPKIFLDKEISNIKAQTLELISQPNLRIDFFANKSGRLSLAGLLVFPKRIADVKIILPQGEEKEFSWEDGEYGLKTVLNEPIEIDVYSGEKVTVLSEKIVNETIYLTIFYQFFPDENTKEFIFPPIEEVYRDGNYEIYKVN